MRRTVSDTTSDPKGKRTQSIAEAMARGDLVDIQDPDHRPLLTQRTTGFAGTVQPPDPQVAAEMPHVDQTRRELQVTCWPYIRYYIHRYHS